MRITNGKQVHNIVLNKGDLVIIPKNINYCIFTLDITILLKMDDKKYIELFDNVFSRNIFNLNIFKKVLL